MALQKGGRPRKRDALVAAAGDGQPTLRVTFGFQYILPVTFDFHCVLLFDLTFLSSKWVVPNSIGRKMHPELLFREKPCLTFGFQYTLPVPFDFHCGFLFDLTFLSSK